MREITNFRKFFDRCCSRFSSPSRSWHVSCFRKAPRAVNGFSIESSKDTGGNSRFHPEVTFSPELFSRTLSQYIPQFEGRNLLNEDPPQGLSLLRWLHLSGRIPVIYGFNYTVRSSSRSKRYNALTLMQTVMDSGEYLCIMIPTIKGHDLDSYEKITMCKLWSYEDPKFSHP